MRRKTVKSNSSNFVAFIVVVGIIGLLSNSDNISRMLESDRNLAQDLGDGNCEYSEPVDDSHVENPGDIHRTLIAGYPGVGKRLVWGLVEQLTNRQVGDTWNFDDHGDNIVGLKTNFPHSEGAWTWGDKMYQSVLVLRNPMDAIISYHNIRTELKPFRTGATNVSEIFELTDTEEIYTKGASIDAWYTWRDAAFDRQLDLYGMVIEYWMDGGRRRNDGEGNPYYDEHCTNDMKGGCVPKAVIFYEALTDPDRGEDETIKLASVLYDSVGVPVVDESIWGCVYRERMKKDSLIRRKRLLEPSRTFNYDRPEGPKDSDKTYSYKQLGAMKKELERLRDKYDHPVYHEITSAAQLVVGLKEITEEVDVAFKEAFNLHKSETVGE